MPHDQLISNPLVKSTNGGQKGGNVVFWPIVLPPPTTLGSLGGPRAKSGLCFPSYEKIAEAAGCARSTVAEALKALEDAGILSWVQRIKRVRERCSDLLGANGWRWRVLRTLNAYNFRDPGEPDPSKSEKPTGTTNQDFFSPIGAGCHVKPLRLPSLPTSSSVASQE